MFILSPAVFKLIRFSLRNANWFSFMPFEMDGDKDFIRPCKNRDKWSLRNWDSVKIIYFTFLGFLGFRFYELLAQTHEVGLMERITEIIHLGGHLVVGM